jgi:hypothetical protein
LHEASESFAEIAAKWTQVAGLFERIAGPQDTAIVQEASATLAWISEAEKKAMTKLHEAGAEL